MSIYDGWLSRPGVAARVGDALRALPVVVVTGLRQAGKTTLLRRDPVFRGRRYLSLDEPCQAAASFAFWSVQGRHEVDFVVGSGRRFLQTAGLGAVARLPNRGEGGVIQPRGHCYRS